MIKLSVFIFGQTTGYRIYTMSRESIRLPKIQHPVFGLFNNMCYSVIWYGVAWHCIMQCGMA